MNSRFFVLVGLFTLPAALEAADQKGLVDGDRVVLIGNTMIEREQRYGYWETALSSRYPTRNIVFRNLGWSGDTVFGEARAGFDTVADGFRRLKEQVLAAKPTVIVLGYGLNESFKGQAGLEEFVRGLNVLLDTLAQTKARIFLLSPLRHENLGPPLPDPNDHNKQLLHYRDAVRKVAEKRGHLFIDLYGPLGGDNQIKPPLALTDDGIHLTAYGYWRSARVIMEGFGIAPRDWELTFDAKGPVQAFGARVIRDRQRTLRFQVTERALPFPPLPDPSLAKKVPPLEQRVLKVSGLAAGKHTLKIDGKPVITAPATDWAGGVRLERGPEFDQVERLRQAIRTKNQLFFHRWRPQNETYLFGFRKHEQGKNAREVFEFDPLIARADAEVARLRVPVSHTYELIPK